MRFYSIAIDHKHKKLYWILGVQGDGGGGIFRSELDGSNAKKIVAEMPFSKQKQSPIHPRSLCLAPDVTSSSVCEKRRCENVFRGRR